MKNKVLVYKPDLLPYSETFIKEQVLAYQRWQGVLVGHRRIPGGLPLDGLDVRLLLNDPPGRVEELGWRLRRWFGWVSRSEVRRLAAENAQLFHAHFGTVAVDIWPLVRALGLPMVVTLHGFDINIHRAWWEAGHGGRRRRSYPHKLLALAQEPRVHFIAVSEAIRQQAIEYGIPADKITVCYIGVDAQRFKPGGLPITQRARRVLFVGRLVEKKGVTYLIEAFAKVAQEIPDAELVIVGDGPLRAQLEEQARSVKGCINFLGALTSDQVKQQMNEARVFCLPSITAENGDAEGFGIVILEAAAMGIPVVSSAFGGAAEGILHGKTGFMFEERKIDLLTERLIFLLQESGELFKVSQAAVNFTKKFFDINYCIENFENLYDDFSGNIVRTKYNRWMTVQMSIFIKPIFTKIKRKIFSKMFSGSQDYWELRYTQGGNSGPGYYGDLANFKAEVLNSFVKQKEISNVVEWGCGDGNQLVLSNYPSYIGFDVSQHAVLICKNKFATDNTKSFALVSDYQGETADLVLSLDVIFHLIEDNIFFEYMNRLFDSSGKYVIIYSSNSDKNEENHTAHVKHRNFTKWIDQNKPEWLFERNIPNKYRYNGDIKKTSFSEFFIYKRIK